MAKLILSEGGETRRFKLSSGTLTFGSGEKATLKLTSDDVAELHGQIEMRSDGAVLRLAKGVMPAKVAGQPLSGPHTMKGGQSVSIGSASITVEYDEGEGPSEASAPAIQRKQVAGRRATGARKGRTRSQPDRDEEEEGGRTRGRVQRQGNAAGFLIGGLIAVGLLGVGYYFVTQTSKGLAGQDFVYATAYDRAERWMESDPSQARSSFKTILTKEITPEQRSAVQANLDKLDSVLSSADEENRNIKGNKWLEERLRKFVDKFDATKSRPHARLFIKRADWFLGVYPTHPERPWIERIKSAVTPAAELGTPQTFEDLEVEVWGSTKYEPKDFVMAYQAIDAYQAVEGDSTASKNLRGTVDEAEKSFYETALANAAISYNKAQYPDQFKPNLAINDMIRVLSSCKSPSYRSGAATRLLGISELDPKYLSQHYKRDRPDQWARMIEDPTFREYCQKNGLL